MKRSQGPSGAGRSASQEAGDDDFLEVVRATSDGILVVDDADLVRFANPAASQVLGRSERELLDLPFGLPLVSSGNFAQIDVTRPDGSTVVVELHVAAGRWRGTDARVVTLRDISARAAAQRELARSEERFALSAAGANDGLWDWEQESGRMHTSARLQEMLGYERIERDESPDALLGLVHPDDVGVLRDEIRRHLTGHSQQFRHEFRLRRRDGSWIWVMARGVGVTDGGQVRRFAGSLTDVTDRKQAEEELRRLALRDSLTGLANRALFLDHLDTAIERRERIRSDFAVLFVDLDRFKLVNDSLGHTAGDIVLVEIGRRLEECLRSVDTVARLGGDEFAVLIDAPEGQDTVFSTVERIRRAIAEPVSVGSGVVRLTASVGVVHPQDVPREADAALRYADIAMYRAKSAGRDAVEVFSRTMRAQAESRMHLHNDLRQAAEEGLLVPHYQPIVDLDDGTIVGFEALVRWLEAPGRVIDAGEFIDTAEEIGLMVTIDREVLSVSSHQLRDWRNQGFDIELTVNLSQRQFVDTDVAEEVSSLLAELGVDATAFGIEITERFPVAQTAAALVQLERLRALGLSIVVDDFGTGYSSLAAVHQLPLTGIKIDKSFISGANGDSAEGIVTAIVAMAEILGLHVVAEGIETPAQRHRLRALGCRRGQGYLFGPAVDARRATELLRAQSSS